MISSLGKSLDLEEYRNKDEQFIHGVKGVVRPSIGKEIMYWIGYTSIQEYISDIPHFYRIECVFAVTDKRILLIPLEHKDKPISFSYGDINIRYYNQIFDKVLLIDKKDKELLNFYEKKLVFSIHGKQKLELNKVSCILREHLCA